MYSKIPIKRKLLTEKFVESKLLMDNNKFILYILDKDDNVLNSYLVMIDYLPTMSISEVPPGVGTSTYEFDRRYSWEPIDIFFLENIGDPESKKTLRWLEMRETYSINVSLNRCYTNETRSSEQLNLYGCINTAIFDYHGIISNKDHGLAITVEFNHCDLTWIN